MQVLSPLELKQRLDAGEKLRLIDVREPEEWQWCRIAGAELRPLSQAGQWIEQLAEGGGPYVFYCHHGRRSGQVCAYLAQRGRQDVYNLSGGIDRWSLQVDPAVPRY